MQFWPDLLSKAFLASCQWNPVLLSHRVLMQLPNFNALFLVSLLAACMSVSYSTIGWVSAVAEGKAEAVSYAILGTSTSKIMGIFNGLGTMVFAYGGHSVVLEIQVGFLYGMHLLLGWAVYQCDMALPAIFVAAHKCCKLLV